MSQTLQCIFGTHDYFGERGARFERAMLQAAAIFHRYGYEKITTPIFETTDLFARGIGAATDIVEKEMYTFTPGSDTITLRPEGTAGVIRAYLQHNFHKQGGLRKLWYAGPMFRRERPMKGRQRQFHQVGVEAVGSSDPLLDAEVVHMGLAYYESLGITDCRTRLNSIGCPAEDCRPRYRQTLRERIEPDLASYCESCRKRFDRNVLRILDCKETKCRDLCASLPKSHECLCAECQTHWDATREGLDAHGVAYTIDGTLVRGLDYYSKTVFEYTHHALGAQDAIGGGGRYDGLVEELGGPAMPAVGFALGVERIMIAMEALGCCACQAPLIVYGVALGELAHKAMSGMLARVRAAGFSADMDYEGRGMKAQMRSANKRGALVALVLGDNELAEGKVQLKDMREGGGQELIPLGETIERIAALVRPAP